MMSCRGAKATSLATKVAEQFGGGGSGMSLRHASTANVDAEAAEPSAHPPPRPPPRVHRPVVRESDMRKFAGQVPSNSETASGTPFSDGFSLLPCVPSNRLACLC